MGLAYKLLAPTIAKAKISKTERLAIEKGDIGFEQGFFRGVPDWEGLRNLPAAYLTEEEASYIDTVGDKLASRANPVEIADLKDLPADMYEMLKKDGWWGLIAEKEYDGLGFSPAANSASIMKFVSVSPELGITFMVPNSLGAIEVIQHAGTAKQKEELLPLLASGERPQCFMLTSKRGGSDAFDGMMNVGTVVKGEDGKPKIHIDKIDNRYITLAPLKGIGVLSFKLRDPDNLLDKGKRPGVTLALLDLEHPNIEAGNRHDPMGVYFQNGAVRGGGFDISIEEDVIGGHNGIGRGTEWVMELLGAGRGISLVAVAAAAGKVISLSTGQYAKIREQFKNPLGNFPGIQERLGRLGSYTYMMDAARCTTLRMVQAGMKPTIASAIVKANLTEMMGTVAKDGMNIQAGKGVMNGYSNMISDVYKAVPIAQTVEGDNIMTENMIVFGQGLMVDHPHMYPMITAAQSGDVETFEKHFKALRQIMSGNYAASQFNIGTASIPDDIDPDLQEYYEKVSRYSAKFALMSGIIGGVFGENLKFAENTTRRMGRVLSDLYLTMSVLEHWREQGSHKEDLPLVEAACLDRFRRIEESFDDLFNNLSNDEINAAKLPGIMKMGMKKVNLWERMRGAVLPHGITAKRPNDKLNAEITEILTNPGPARDRLVDGIYIPSIGEKFNSLAADGKTVTDTPFVKPLAQLAEAEPVCLAAQAPRARLAKATRAEMRHITKGEAAEFPALRQVIDDVLEDDRESVLQAAFEDAVLTKDELALVKEADRLAEIVIDVDEFTQDMKPVPPKV